MLFGCAYFFVRAMQLVLYVRNTPGAAEDGDLQAIQAGTGSSAIALLALIPLALGADALVALGAGGSGALDA